MELCWHTYRYFPYEKELALREIRALAPLLEFAEVKNGIQFSFLENPEIIDRLVYFKNMIADNSNIYTLQGKLEQSNFTKQQNRQVTRYSVHGIHEYRGKFNPQVARAILNVLNIPKGARILDPFCGSGTSLVEAAHIRMHAIGTDINPLAVYIANAKLTALHLPVCKIQKELKNIIERFEATHAGWELDNDERIFYLKAWFREDILKQIECLRHLIEHADSEFIPLLLSIASNLLREYSLQDPHDLRIRRRKTPLPEIPFIDTFTKATMEFCSKIQNVQMILGDSISTSKAYLIDSRKLKLEMVSPELNKFDCVLTSPPYATALPYIDTQRLSLVWLNLLSPQNIIPFDSSLVGSREIRGLNKQERINSLLSNDRNIPEEQLSFCITLQGALAESDGFRRQAVPFLLYRYFADMMDVFRSVHSCVKINAPFALIVGSNHTILGGHRFDIDTPQHLVELASSVGWKCEEIIPLQTYQRYGYQKNNSVSSESLVIVRAI